MIKLKEILSSLNFKTNQIYPDVYLKDKGNKIYEIYNNKNDEIGVVVLKDIEGLENVIYSIYINEEFRDQSYSIPIYVGLANILGHIHSGEYKNDGSVTSFSKGGSKIWNRLKEIYPKNISKIQINNDKFRYKLTSK